MVKKDTLESKIDSLTNMVQKGFMAVAEDIAGIKCNMATKEDLEKLATKVQLSDVHTQVNSIERQLRETKPEIRLGDLEEKVFGKIRA